MKRVYLGEFEELILLAVAVLDEAYGVSLLHEVMAKGKREAKLSQVHASLQRLEEKGMVKSFFGEPTPERGGKRKRIFKLTVLGQRTLHEIQQIRADFWSRMPGSQTIIITG